jgi:TRAP-type C4-dicarboxylate transport system substrate-binding protein
VLKAASDAETRGWKSSMAETDAKIKILKDNGMQVPAPSSKLMSGLKGIGKTMTDEWVAKAGSDGGAIIKAFDQ